MQLVGGFVALRCGLTQSTAALQIQLAPVRLAEQRPFAGLDPFFGAADPDLDGRLVHDARINALEPVVEPAEDLIMPLVVGSFSGPAWFGRLPRQQREL